MRKILFLFLFFLSLSMCYSLSVESREVSYLEQAIDVDIKIPPGEIDKVFLSTPQHTRLVKWILPYEHVLYEYESRGATVIHSWEFTERNRRQLMLVAKVQFNNPGDHSIYIYSEGDKEGVLIEKNVWVIDESLCGNKICDENEEITCPEDCPKFELPSLPQIPSWMIHLSIIIFIVVLIIVFIKLRYWY